MAFRGLSATLIRKTAVLSDEEGARGSDRKEADLAEKRLKQSRSENNPETIKKGRL